MQIIKLWFKISTILALLGWAAHTINPNFAAWLDAYRHNAGDVTRPQSEDAVLVEPAPPESGPSFRLNE